MARTSYLYCALQSSVMDAGKVMMSFRGKVQNKSKNQAGDLTEAGMAFTEVDEIAQEIILAKLYDVNPKFMVNAEEDTPLRKLFKGNQHDITVHIDPIDGTLSYLNGKDTFSSGCAISISGQFTHTIIHAPARGLLYTASPEGYEICKVSANSSISQFSKKTLFAKKIFSENGIKALEGLGYEVIPDNYGAHVSSIDAILDDIAGLIHGFTNPHDMLVAAAFARAKNKVPYGIDGKEVLGKDLVMRIEDGLPVYERIPVVAYFSNEDKDKILPLMLDKSLWSQKFLEKVESSKTTPEASLATASSGELSQETIQK